MSPRQERPFAFRPSTLVLIGAACTALAVVSGCGSGQQKTRTLPSQTMSNVEPSSSELQEATAQPEEYEADAVVDETEGEVTAADEEEVDPTVIVIDSPSDPSARPSLVEAARAERERRREAGEPAHVVTDKNLAEYTGGELTIVESSEPAEQETTANSDEPAQDEVIAAAGEDEEKPADEKRGEEYWRNRALQIRLSWRDAQKRIEELEIRAAELRQRFYAEDDGYYRDSQIKPAWDRVIDQLEEAKRSVVARQEELADFLEEGRRAGALPGWLREGIEFEPVLEDAEDDIQEPSEPVVMQEGGGNR